jgi:outer membrane protein, heavy metal efflux system
MKHPTSNLTRPGRMNFVGRWTLDVRCWMFSVLLLFAAGCATFHSQPISPEKTAAAFDARSLTNENLHAFLETNGVAGEWPRESWDLNALTLAAFYYQPALAEARAQLRVAQAAKITAGERPNSSISVTPGYDTQIPNNPSPWMVPMNFDVPIETAGKRGKRIAVAEHLAEAARWNLVGQIWQTRSQVRAALLALYSARENDSLLAQQEMAQSNVVRLLEGQFSAGNVSSFEVTQARVALETTQLARQDALGQIGQARAQLAGALGVPLRALKGIKISFADFKIFPRDLTAPEIQRRALLDRADVRGALAEYAASQSALQLEIANQYPDVNLGPGYAWNNGNAGDNEWSLGLTVTLPVFNQNQGPIAEAKANRSEAAAHFLTVQATAISEINSALAAYDAALKKSALAKKLLDDLRKQLDSVRAQAQLGEVDALTLANAEAEYAVGTQNQTAALVQAQQALGDLEDAVQSPLTLPPEVIHAAEIHKVQK